MITETKIIWEESDIRGGLRVCNQSGGEYILIVIGGATRFYSLYRMDIGVLSALHKDELAGLEMAKILTEWAMIPAKQDSIHSKDISECFAGVDWGKQSFRSDGDLMKSDDGQSLFYKAQGIDLAIKKLDALLGCEI